MCSQSAARSTGVHDVHMVSSVDRPVDRGRERSIGPVDRLKGAKPRLVPVDRVQGSVDWPVDWPVDRQTRFDFPFGIQIPFLDGSGFP